MEKNEAEKLVSQFRFCQKQLDDILITIDQLGIPQEQKVLDQLVKRIIAEIYTDAMMPIISQYPDLNPYKN